MCEAAPPYRGEGPHAVWHASANPEIRVFAPHRAPTTSEDEPLVWAVEERSSAIGRSVTPSSPRGRSACA